MIFVPDYKNSEQILRTDAGIGRPVFAIRSPFEVFRMTIVQLEYLLAVANYGSFSQAAEKCFVTQPSLSM